MAAVAATQSLVNASATSFPVDMIDESGTGTGPYTPRHAPTAGSVVEHSSSITTGGTQQSLMAANTARKRLRIVNPPTAAGQGGIAAAESLFIRFGANAGINDGFSEEIAAGGSWDSGAGPCPSNSVSIIGATTGHKFIAWEL